MKVWVQYPSRSRIDLFRDNFPIWFNVFSECADVHFNVVVDEDDPQALLYSRFLAEYDLSPNFSAPNGKIAACNYGVDVDWWDDEDLIILAADDHLPLVSDFDLMVKGVLQGGGVLKCTSAANIIDVPIMTVRYFRLFGYVYNENYSSLWCDNELFDVSRQLGALVVGGDFVRNDYYEHDNDVVRERNNGFYDKDKELYGVRSRTGFLEIV